MHALLGENGAGKTTLCNLLMGLYRPDEGKLFVGGKPVRLRSPRDAQDEPASSWSTSTSGSWRA